MKKQSCWSYRSSQEAQELPHVPPSAGHMQGEDIDGCSEGDQDGERYDGYRK